MADTRDPVSCIGWLGQEHGLEQGSHRIGEQHHGKVGGGACDVKTGGEVKVPGIFHQESTILAQDLLPLHLSILYPIFSHQHPHLTNSSLSGTYFHHHHSHLGSPEPMRTRIMTLKLKK